MSMQLTDRLTEGVIRMTAIRNALLKRRMRSIIKRKAWVLS